MESEGPAGLIIQGTSPIEEIDSQMIATARDAFAGDNVMVDHYYDDFSPLGLEELENRSMRSTLILFDYLNTQIVIDDDRRQSNDRIQREVATVGFYAIHASVRDDYGISRRYSCYRAIERLRSRFSQYRVEVTVDNDGNKSNLVLRPLEVQKIRNIPRVAVYQVAWTIQLARDLKWKERT